MGHCEIESCTRRFLWQGSACAKPASAGEQRGSVLFALAANPFPLLDGREEARGLLFCGNKIGAIKLVGDIAGLELTDAKNLVESWEK
jgi:hypothetical protein